MLTKEQISENRERFISLLKSIGRAGTEDVIDFLDQNDFFNIPSSLHRHHNWDGGLAEHCLGVLDRLRKTGEQLPEDSVIATSLLHDICKAGKVFKDDAGEWVERDDEELDIPGHGERSVKLLEKLGFPLTSEEKGAIKWHRGGWKIADYPKEEIKDFFATKRSDLWRLLHNADRYDASHASR